MRLVFDSNIVIKILNNDLEIIAKFNQFKEYFITSISLGELYFGAAKSMRASENTKTIDLLSANSRILNADAKSAKEYGIIKSELKKRGNPVPENDLWIAAICRANDCTLAPLDKHFLAISDFIKLYEF